MEIDLEPDRLNRWITLGANIGVLVGIFLLVLEINQNSELMQIQIEQSRSEAYVAWHREMASNDALTELRAKGYVTRSLASVYDELNEVERTRVRLMMTARFYDYENLYSQYERGFVSEEYWQERAVPAIRNLAPFWKEIWGPDLLSARRAFKDEIERVLF